MRKKLAFTENQEQNIWPKIKKIEQNCTRPENFDICFSVGKSQNNMTLLLRSNQFF